MRMLRWLALAAALAAAPAWSQTSKFPGGGGQAVSNQGYSSAAITPSDSVQIQATRAIYNGNATACIISMQLNGDTAPVTWNNVQPGQILPVQAILVRATTTTCTGLIAIY
jgi:hypothetical protein